MVQISDSFIYIFDREHGHLLKTIILAPQTRRRLKKIASKLCFLTMKLSDCYYALIKPSLIYNMQNNAVMHMNSDEIFHFLATG